MLPIIQAALGLAQFAPSVMRYFGAGENATSVAERVVNTAQAVVGGATPAETLELMRQDAAAQHAFAQRALEISGELDQAYLLDTQNARQREIELARVGVRTYRASLLVASALALVILCLAVVVWYADINEFAKGAVTLILGRALGWVEQVFSYEFGTTRSSKSKDDTINNLTK